MDFISSREAAEKWGISQTKLDILCSEKKIQGAKIIENMWIIPSNAQNSIYVNNLIYNENKDNYVRPFLKWVGGKGQLIRKIRKYYPFNDKNITKYAEPFVGGGAILFDILNRYNLNKIYISDVNAELINTYKVIRDDIKELIRLLKILQLEYISLSLENQKSYYQKKRDRFNSLKINGNEFENIEKAALMIFLNKTCFNGLYRVNKEGFFNVPMGAYKNPLICDEKNLYNVSYKLKDVTIVCGDYRKSKDFIDNHTFVYLDPPYRPLNNTSSFTSYTETIFDDNEQIELSNFIDDINMKGAKIVLSNSDPKNIDSDDNFFDNVYSEYKIKRVYATRMINSNSSARGKIKELIISNFEEKKMERDFDMWLSSFRDSIADYDYYTDFDKVYKNIDKINVELNILNSLIGSENIEEDFENLIQKYPEVLKCIPLLLAVRASEMYVIDGDGEYTYNFNNKNLSAEQYKIFMRKTGLFDLIGKHIINNLVDYATGVETGLDSNARKNRGGHLMENLVESFIVKAGFKKDKNYFKEMNITTMIDLWDIDLSAISNQGKSEKRFDFVIKTDKMIYGIETNFYRSGGSKLNETARSYKNLSLETDTIDGFTFVWFTDGKGWSNARHNLEETFDVMKHIYNIKDLENGVVNKIFV
ncbi:DpnII family type II restriction endonuclease [Anaerofustis stercorihominis]|uniref:Site-specific DNA-methyltransferase (adenine-specific) n=1 Tax=Anaerofustis stercorihominis TaxID=214853 RepID=A0A3E3DYV9_9FIRM|nr:Dam family site-specific DNA-(adenine-N6)-methyltransferase [Anaerofustis stercorihominis]